MRRKRPKVLTFLLVTFLYIFIDWWLVLGIKLGALHKLEKLLTSDLHCQLLMSSHRAHDIAKPDLEPVTFRSVPPLGQKGWTIIAGFCIFIDLDEGSEHLIMTLGGPWTDVRIWRPKLKSLWSQSGEGKNIITGMMISTIKRQRWVSWHIPVIPVLVWRREEDSVVKVIFISVVILRPVCATRDTHRLSPPTPEKDW